MNIKISTFKSRLKHSLQFDEEISSFLSGIQNKLNAELKFADLNDYDCDLKLIFIQTGGSEGLFCENFDLLQEPYYLLTNGSNNSLAASLEILTYLNKLGKKGEVLHGDVDYIAARIGNLATVAKAKRELENSRLGVLGKPSNWLISSVPNYGDVKSKLGVTLVDVPLAEVEKLARETAPAQKCENYVKYNDKEVNAAATVLDALDKIARNYKLDGLTIRCFDLLTSLKTTGCLALAELNSRGITGTCEGDVAAMLSMHVAKLLTGKSNFQANPSRINTAENRILFAHCTVPFDMTESYKFDTHFESGIGVAVKGELKTGRVTVFRISADLKRYFVSGGTLIANTDDKNLCRTQIIVELDKPVTELLKAPCGNHHVVMYGDHADLIEQFMNTVL